MRATRWIAALAMLALGAPTAVRADAVSDGGNDDVQEQLQIMQQRLKRMEDQLREAERRAPPPAPAGEARAPSFWDKISFNGWIAGSWFYNFEDPAGPDLGGFNSGAVTAYPFHPDANSFSMDQLWLGMEKPVSEEDRAGFRADFVFGKTADLLNNGIFLEDGFSGTDEDFHLYQAYIQYLAPVGPGVTVKFGKFATLLGSEVVQATGNLNVTRGHLYNLFQPITHVGVLATTSLWEGGTISAGLVDETRAFPARDVDVNNDKAFLWQVGHKFNDQFNAYFNGVTGDSDSGQLADTPDGDQETIYDVILNWTPSEKFYAYINADYIDSENSNFGAEDTSGYGLSVAGRYAMTEKLGAAMRVEWVDLEINSDPDELQIWGITGTMDYLLTSNLKLRAEVRYDSLEGDLDSLFFDSRGSLRGVPRSGQQLTEDENVTAGFEVIYTF